MPSFAGSALWAKSLLQRISLQHTLLATSYHVVSTREFQEVNAQFQLVENAMKEYMNKVYNDWQEHLQDVFRGANQNGMELFLIVRKQETLLLEVNFSPELLKLYKEVDVWERVGFSIPFIAMENAKDKDRINIIRFHVRGVVRDYNKIISSLASWCDESPPAPALVHRFFLLPLLIPLPRAAQPLTLSSIRERKLFSEKIKSLDRKISPAINKMTWHTKGIVDFFCKDTKKQCHVVQQLVDDFKGLKDSVFRDCADLGNLSMIAIESKRLYSAEEFSRAQESHRKVTMDKIQSLHANMKSTLKRMYSMFIHDGAESLREWERFISRIDGMVQDSLTSAVRRSLQDLARAINGDKKTEPQQLFRIRVVLDSSSKVAFSPSLSDLTQMINSCSKELISMLDVIPRLHRLVEAEVRRELADADGPGAQREDKHGGRQESIATCIANEDEILKVMVAIMGGISSNVGKMQKQLTYWEKFNHIWEYDKDAFFRRYAKSNRPLSAFEEDILRSLLLFLPLLFPYRPPPPSPCPRPCRPLLHACCSL
eukprot:758242-Hanusia_phi.AAC.10